MPVQPAPTASAGTSTAPRLWLPDALRFPAALGVVAFHVLLSVQGQRQTGDASAWWLGWLGYGGTVGVSLFFVLSGFGVHLGRARARAAGRDEALDTALFAQRRFWRLYPAYAAAMCLSLAVGVIWAWWRGRDVTAALPSTGNLLAHVFLVHSLSPATYFGVVPAFWFVGVLAHLLLLYPVYLAVMTRWGTGRVLLGALAFTLLYRMVIATLPGLEPVPRAMWLSNAPGRWWEWVLGATLATAVSEHRASPWQTGVAALALVPAWLVWGGTLPVLYEPVLGGLLGLALWWGLTNARFRRTRPLPTALRWAGNVSYPVYLIHQMFLPYISSAFLGRPLASVALFATVLTLVLGVTLPVAAALHRWVETPLAEWGR